MYYRLTYVSSSEKEKVGDHILCGFRPLHIGQESSCGLRLPDNGNEPQIYATILPSNDSSFWYIVRRTDWYDILIGDKPLLVATPLHDGDILTFRDSSNTTSLKFKVHTDGDYNQTSGVTYHHRNNNKLSWIAIAILFILIVGILIIRPWNQRTISTKEYEPSIFHIMTDYVYLVCDTIIDGKPQEVIKSSAESHTVGTCFLTSDSLFVTARHCIEPWINDVEWDGIPNSHTMSDAVRLATTAETINRLEGKQRYKMRTHCVIYRDTLFYDFYSTDFKMNKSRDQVLPLGTEENPIYWRSIVPIALRRNMELGDFAYIESGDISGNIEMASIDDLVQFNLQDKEKDISVIGFPETDNGSERLIVTRGISNQVELDGDNSPKGCIMINASINSGNSGGPILALIGDKVKVIGIVSKVDSKATEETFWAVPITEVPMLKKRGGKINQDSLVFRR